MPRAVIIQEATFIVSNVVNVGNVLPDLPLGFRYLRESDWPGQSPNIGDIWAGDMPATFTPPEPVAGGDLETLEVYQLIERQKALAIQAGEVAAMLEAKLGG